MQTMTWKVVAILLLFIGEALSVYAEMIAAHDNWRGAGATHIIYSKAFLMITVAGAFLIAGYMVGLRSFENIWVVTALSVTSILFVEPLIAFGIFRTLPTKGAAIGMVLGAFGFVASFK